MPLSIESVFDTTLVFLSLLLLVDVVRTYHTQKRVLHEIENRKSTQKARSKILLDKVLDLLDTKWTISTNCMTAICLCASLLIVLFDILDLDTVAIWTSKIASILSLTFTVVVSKRNNNIHTTISKMLNQ